MKKLICLLGIPVVFLISCGSDTSRIEQELRTHYPHADRINHEEAADGKYYWYVHDTTDKRREHLFTADGKQEINF